MPHCACTAAALPTAVEADRCCIAAARPPDRPPPPIAATGNWRRRGGAVWPIVMPLVVVAPPLVEVAPPLVPAGRLEDPSTCFVFRGCFLPTRVRNLFSKKSERAGRLVESHPASADFESLTLRSRVLFTSLFVEIENP